MRIRFFLLLILLESFSACSDYDSFKPDDLNLNHRITPICIGDDDYRLGWLVSDDRIKYQSAYQVQISSDSGFEDDELIYDSGKVTDYRSQNIRPGKELPKGKALQWRVKLWDEKNSESDWSDPFSFYSAPEWRGQWITTREHEVSLLRQPMGTFLQQSFKNPEDSVAIYMNKEIELPKKIKEAQVYIIGLGYHELTINAKKIGKNLMDPVFSDFQKSLYFSTYDVTEDLIMGKNSIDVILGNGFYNLYTQNLFMIDQSEWKTPHKLLFQMHIEFEDGSSTEVLSDESWKWGIGPIIFNSIMGGITLDARNIPPYDSNVLISEGPGGLLKPQLIPSMIVNKRIPPRSIVRLNNDTYIADFGENITGSVSLKIPKAEPGHQLKIFYNEVVDSAGFLIKNHSKTHTRGRFQEDRYISKGTEDKFENPFSYFGFRYVQIENFPGAITEDDIEAISVHTAMEYSSTFNSSEERLNHLHSAINRTLKNSIHGMPGEEPTREKMGWTFDAGMNCMEPYLYHFNSIPVYEKYLIDLVDAQEPGGHIPPIVPTNGWGFLDEDSGKPILYDDPWWGGTILYVMDELYNWTGDTSYYYNYYDPLKAYTDYVISTADDSLIVHWSLGDWLDPENFKYGWGPGLTSIETTSTLGLYYLASGTARIAGLIGNQEEEKKYAEIAANVKESFLKFLYNEDEVKPFLSQTGHALPLWLGIFESSDIDSAYHNLLMAINHKEGHIYSGFIGIKPIVEILASRGDLQLAFDMFMKENSPGWLHMVADEYSTMGENMNAEGYGTGHHPFGANIGYWYYKHILGPRPGIKGWKNFEIKPFLPEQLDFVEGTVVMPYGKCYVSIKRLDDRLKIDVDIPFNTSATFIHKDEILSPSKQYQKNKNGWLKLEPGKHSLEIISQ